MFDVYLYDCVYESCLLVVMRAQCFPTPGFRHDTLKNMTKFVTITVNQSEALDLVCQKDYILYRCTWSPDDHVNGGPWECRLSV